MEPLLLWFGARRPLAEWDGLVQGLLGTEGCWTEGRGRPGLHEFIVMWCWEGQMQRAVARAPFVRYMGRDEAHSRGLDSAVDHRHRGASVDIVKEMDAALLWAKGAKGQGVKVAVLDTGLDQNHRHFDNIIEATDWTDDHDPADRIGHGTHVCGVIASSFQGACSGLAPEVQIYSMKVFNRHRISRTSWFLEAFDHAMELGVDIINVSIGGPDFLDLPFRHKIHQLTAKGIIVVSANGNSGPGLGTVQSPADQPDVIAVGGATGLEGLAPFSSRGMTLWELPHVGRIKPDVLALASGLEVCLSYPRPSKPCTTVSGTSFAAPIVTGAIALLKSHFGDKVNAASVRAALIVTSDRLHDTSVSIVEQGPGLLHLGRLFDYFDRKTLQEVAQPTSFPQTLDMVHDCPYLWPWCSQPLYDTRMPLEANITLLQPQQLTDRVVDVQWVSKSTAVHITFTSTPVQSGVGTLGVSLSASSVTTATEVHGTIHVDLASSSIRIPVVIQVIPTPPRSRRLVWDQFHSLGFPTAFYPKDSLGAHSVLDWNGDHLYTNFHGLYRYLIQQGWYLEMLSTDWSCLDASLYRALLVVDPERVFTPTERRKVQYDVRDQGLELIVVAEWSNAVLASKLQFRDNQVGHMRHSVLGGANLPSVNALLHPFGIQMSSEVYTGHTKVGARDLFVDSSSSIAHFPAGGRVLFGSGLKRHDGFAWGSYSHIPLVGTVSMDRGTVTVLSDSACLDSTADMGFLCYWLLEELLSSPSSIPMTILDSDLRGDNLPQIMSFDPIHDPHWRMDPPQCPPDFAMGSSDYKAHPISVRRPPAPSSLFSPLYFLLLLPLLILLVIRLRPRQPHNKLP